jgi:PEP-CTERM motif
MKFASLLRLFAVAACLLSASMTEAALTGTVFLPPTTTVVPGLVPSATDPGTLLASLSSPFTTVDASGTVLSAVYREATGMLDFYYQVVNGAGSSGSIARETDSIFGSFITSVGFRTDGGSLTGTGFTDAIVTPVTADRNSTGLVVGFSFNPPDSAKIQPGQTSAVLVISTNATNFTSGFASVIDGGATTVASFAPTAIPEPSSVALLVMGGVLAASCLRRKL